MIGALLAGCATVAPLTLEDIAFDPSANRLDVSRMSDGLLTIPVTIDGDAVLPFILDTGATRSVLFEDSLARLTTYEDSAVRVHGLSGVKVSDTVKLSRVALGRHELEDLSFIVLPKRELKDVGDIDPAGIIGMDILSNYRLLSLGPSMDASSAELILLQAEGDSPLVPANWTRIPLMSDPFGVDTRSLRFMDVRLNGKVSAALLDTGSSVNVLSYEFADFPMVRAARRQLQRQFEVQGALETFRPRVFVKGLDFRAGSHVWRDEPFIVKEVDSLEILGVKGQPFMIAGVGLFADEVFYLDLAEGELRMPRAGASAFGVQEERRTGSRAGGLSSTVTRVSPSGRTQ